MSGCLFFLYWILRQSFGGRLVDEEGNRATASQKGWQLRKRGRTESNRSARSRGGAGDSESHFISDDVGFQAVQLSTGPVAVVVSAGSLWALTTYWMPTTCQAGAGFFSCNLTESSRQTQGGGQEGSEAHESERLLQGHTAVNS